MFSAEAFREQLLNAGRAVLPADNGGARPTNDKMTAFRRQVAGAHASQANVVLSTPLNAATDADESPSDNVIPFPLAPKRRFSAHWFPEER